MTIPRWSLAVLVALVLLACGRASPPAPAEAGGDAGVAALPASFGAEIGDAARGQEIFQRGVSASGNEISAELGDGAGMVVPAASLPCLNCHGRDGRGKPEGGITPSNLRWESLTRPYAVTEASGREHPPYTERLVGRAITMGLDPAGHKLDGAMPRYRLSRQDLVDVIAYLKALSTERDPGLGDDVLRIGTLDPASGPLAEPGRAARAALAAFFAELDRTGGVYGRRIELVSAELPEGADAGERRRAVDDFLDKQRPFALTGALLAADDDTTQTALEGRRVPLIAAVSARAPARARPLRYVFHLRGGAIEQSEALARFAERELHATRAAVLREADPDQRAASTRIAARLGLSGGVDDLEVAEGPEGASGAAAKLSRARADVVFVIGPARVVPALLQEPTRSAWRGTLLVPGALLGEELFTAPPTLIGHLFAGLPTQASDRTPEAMEAYRRLAREHHLGGEHLEAQLGALTAAKLLVEGLKRAGRDVTRESLVDTVEGMRDFRTGFSPPLTFGKSRRIGAPGAYVVEIDLKNRRFIPKTEWVAAD